MGVGGLGMGVGGLGMGVGGLGMGASIPLVKEILPTVLLKK